jgi:ABC-2 type transport system permease protein
VATSSPLVLLKPGLYALGHRLRARVVIRRLPFILMGLAFWALLYYGTAQVLSYVREIEFVGDILAMRLFSLMFFSLMGFLFLSNLVTAISSFYLSSDLPLLRSLPVGEGAILTQKTVYGMMDSSWMVASFVPPVLVAFGTEYGAGAGYYLVAFTAFVLFMLITGGLGIAAAHVLTRLFPAGRVRDALLLVALIFFVAAYYVVRSAVPEDFARPVEMVNRIMSFRVDSPILPSYWITQAATPYLTRGTPDYLYLIALLTNGAFFLMVSGLVGLRLYSGNLDRLAPSGGKRTPGRLGYYPGARAALLYKDVKVFVRDKAQWSQLLVILALAFVYVYNFRIFDIAMVAEAAPYIREGMLLANLLLAGMVLSAVAARFLYTAVSAEGRAFWVVKSAPVGMRRFLLEKLVYGSVPVTALTLAMVLVTDVFMKMRLAHILVSLGTVLVLGVSVSAMGVGLGAIYPRFKYENLASVSMSLGGLSFMLLAFTLVVATVLVETWIVYLYYSRGLFPWAAAIAAGVFIICMNFLAAYYPMRIGIRRLSYNTQL